MFTGSFLHETPLHMWSRLPALFMVGSHSLLREVGYEKFKVLPYINYYIKSKKVEIIACE